MRIVCLLGSPRSRGNSTAVARHFCETAEKKGASIQTFALNKLNYRGCQACMTCKTKLDRCVLKDDLTEVLDAIRDADVLVMATPVYYGEVSSQLKAFIDRTFSYLVPDFETNPAPSPTLKNRDLQFLCMSRYASKCSLLNRRLIFLSPRNPSDLSKTISSLI